MSNQTEVYHECFEMVSLFSTSTHTHVNINTHYTYTHTHTPNINHLPHSHCMCGIMNVVFRSTSGECDKPFDVKVMVQIHFFSASFFPSYHDSATLMAGMEGAATFVRRSILDVSMRMWYLN